MVFFFPLTWHEKVENNTQEIECFGWTEENEYCCLTIQGFTPFLYVKLRVPRLDTEQVKQILRQKRIPYISATEIQRRGLYSNRLKGLEWYCFIPFQHSSHRAMATKALNPRYQICENNAAPSLQMACARGINLSDWFRVAIGQSEEVKKTSCAREYVIHWKELFPVLKEDKPQFIPEPRVLAYDIETFAHDVSIFPDPKDPRDVIFQISIVVNNQPREHVLLTLGVPCWELLDEDLTVYTFPSEKKMLLFFAELVRRYSPQILIGYNTFGFDNKYMVERSNQLFIADDFSRQGCTNEKVGVHSSKWSSSAYSNQEYFYLDVKGRIHVDLLLFVKREYTLDAKVVRSVMSARTVLRTVF